MAPQKISNTKKIRPILQLARTWQGFLGLTRGNHGSFLPPCATINVLHYSTLLLTDAPVAIRKKRPKNCQRKSSYCLTAPVHDDVDFLGLGNLKPSSLESRFSSDLALVWTNEGASGWAETENGWRTKGRHPELATQSARSLPCWRHQCVATETAKCVSVDGQYIEKEWRFGDSNMRACFL
jgi:hypothetical protein